MIGFLRGQVKSSRSAEILLLVGNVGYQVNLKASFRPQVGSDLELYIYSHIREEEFSLYGFTSEEEVSTFKLLMTVSGVGPKVALNILSASNIDGLKKAIVQTNLSFFTTISGVGKKTAQKIILELRPKFEKGDLDLSALEQNPDLFQALKNLGFASTEIQKAVSQIDNQIDLADQIKQALKIIKT